MRGFATTQVTCEGRGGRLFLQPPRAVKAPGRRGDVNCGYQPFGSTLLVEFPLYNSGDLPLQLLQVMSSWSHIRAVWVLGAEAAQPAALKSAMEQLSPEARHNTQREPALSASDSPQEPTERTDIVMVKAVSQSKWRVLRDYVRRAVALQVRDTVT